jgi:hypothetical protein
MIKTFEDARVYSAPIVTEVTAASGFTQLKIITNITSPKTQATLIAWQLPRQKQLKYGLSMRS